MYEINATFPCEFETAKTKLFAILTDNQLSVVSDVDVQATMKNKLDKEIPPYHIYGGCNAKLAEKIIDAEPNAGTLLPCTFILRETPEGNTVVSFMDPETILTGHGQTEAVKEVGLIAKQKILNIITQIEAE